MICKKRSLRHEKFGYKYAFNFTENTGIHSYCILKRLLDELKQCYIKRNNDNLEKNTFQKVSAK